MVILGKMKKWCMVENLEVQNCTSKIKPVRGCGITGTWGIEQVVYAYASWIVVAALQRTIF